MNTMKGLEYVLLAGLWVEPRSGYDLTQWFKKAASHFWAAHHSSIYPALASLEHRALVTHQLAVSERGPKRKVYSLTALGTAALEEWLQHAPNLPEVRDEQLVKVLALDLLPHPKAIAFLEAIKTRAQTQRDTYAALLKQLDTELATTRLERHWLGSKLNLMRAVRVQESHVHWCEDALELLHSLKP